MVNGTKYPFYQLIIERGLTEEELDDFYHLCEALYDIYKEDKAEKYVYYSPLYKKFAENLHPRLQPKEVIEACLQQHIYPKLMSILKKNL